MGNPMTVTKHALAKQWLALTLAVMAVSAQAASFEYRQNLSGLGLKASSTIGPAPAPASNVTLSLPSWNFGSVGVGNAPTKTFTLTNSGNAPASLSFEPLASPFSVANSCGAQLAASSSCDFTVEYRPTAEGPSSGTVAIAAGAKNLTVSLQGAATAATPTVEYVGIGTLTQFHQQNYTLGEFARDGNLLYGGDGGRAAYAYVDINSGVKTAITLSANWTGFGLPGGGNARVYQVFNHPTDATLKVLAGYWDATEDYAFVALAKANGEVTALGFVAQHSSPPYATMHGSNVYVHSSNQGGKAIVCSVGAATVSCASSYFGGIYPTVDTSGKLHAMRFMSPAMQISVFENGVYTAPTYRAVTGIPAAMNSIDFGSDGNLYATVSGSPAVWKIDRNTWNATVFAGSATETGNSTGTIHTARFSTTINVQRSPRGLYVKDPTNRILYEIKL